MLKSHELQSLTEHVRTFKKLFSNHHKIHGTTIATMYEKLKSTENVLDRVILIKTKEITLSEITKNIEKMRKMCEETPSASVRQ